jgi:hypothetical protein
MATADPATLMIGGMLIDATDESGYLRADLDEMAQRLGTDRARIERVLALCHRFEPTGVMARDVRECLMLQLAEQNRLDPIMQALLDNLDKLARRDFAGLMQACGCADAQAGGRFWRRNCANGGARRLRQGRPARDLACGAEQRHAAQGVDEPALFRRGQPHAAQ